MDRATSGTIALMDLRQVVQLLYWIATSGTIAFLECDKWCSCPIGLRQVVQLPYWIVRLVVQSLLWTTIDQSLRD